MNKLSTFEVNDSFKLFELTKRLNSSKFFKNFLNDSQHKLLNFIINLDNFKIWDNFLQGNCYIELFKDDDFYKLIEEQKAKEEEEEKEKEKEREKEKEKEKDKPDDKDITKEKEKEIKDKETTEEDYEIDIEDGLKTVKRLALHIRYLLWEKAIDFYYANKDVDESTNTIEEVNDDYALLDSLDNIQPSEESDKMDIDKPPTKPSVRDEEDDYDDEEEEEEEKPEDKLRDSNDDKDLKFNDDNQLILALPMSIFVKEEDQENSLEDQENLIKEFNKVYHNFEYDRETLIKRRKLEKSDLKLEKNSQPVHTNKPEVKNTNNNVEFAFATGSSLKHLLNTIQSQRDQIPLNDYELRTLFMDVKKNRGKWASDERIGQEELYDACEKVVLELRSYTEHSTPFLNKVSKREAPNYGLIIKKPMDLNTVMKKLKNLQYNSKQEFVDDIMLIWSNCLTYNADPKHFLRVHALAMQKKALKLVPHIPNITIKNRSEIEKDDEKDEIDEEGKGKSSKKGRKRTRNEEIKLEHETLDSPDSLAETPIIEEEKEKVSETPIEPTPMPEETPAPVTAGNGEEEEEEDDNDDDNDENNNQNEADEIGPELQAWRTLTAKSRANYCAARARLFEDSGDVEDLENLIVNGNGLNGDKTIKLNMNAPAIIREPSEMANFNNYISNQVVSKGSLLDNDEPYLLEYDISGGLPGIKYEGIDDETQDKQEKKVIDSYINNKMELSTSGFSMSTENGLNSIYFQNINQMQEIRKICFKISLIRQMQTQQFVHHTQMRQPEIETLKEIDIDPISKLENHDPYNKDIQFHVLRRNVGKIAMQTGFEITESSAINTLTQLAEKYLSNLIKSLKVHKESSSSNKLSSDESLLVTLIENGINKPDDLYTFINEKLINQLTKLKDLRSKLSNFLKELLRPGLENFNEKSFNDNSEQFMTGDFSNDLGDDFFGFKELGLDKEFNMLSSSIPIYLLHSRLNNSFNSNGSTIKAHKFDDLKDFKVNKLYGNDISSQIEILQPFYTKLLEKSKAHFVKQQKKNGLSTDLPELSKLPLIDDEELPQKQRNIRPRLPPTGKITSIKKKPLIGSFFLEEEESLPLDSIQDSLDPDNEDPFGINQDMELDANEIENMMNDME